jgi:CubicO group peptidase (beta-lactamase class C family)
VADNAQGQKHMIRYRHWILAGLLLPLTATAEMASMDDPALLEAYVEGIVQPLMRSYSSPSGTVAIARGGELILAKGFGFEDFEARRPVDPRRTLFRPGSVSKLITWVAVMQLVERGELDLDADVNSYLKTFRIRDTFEQPVTLRHILTHTPGFEDGGLGYLIVEDPDKALPLADAMKRYQPRRVNPPGVQSAYSNYATALAGLIIANVSGLSFQEYVQRNILNPLGMENSTFVEPLPEPLAARMATGYSANTGTFAPKPFEIINSFAPAGAMSATSTDMVRFAQAILNGGELDGNRILKQETVTRMLAQHFTHDERLMGMALGFYATDFNGYRVLGHGGDTRWFHSYLGIDEQNDLAFFVSFTASGGSAVRFAFVSALYDAFFPRHEDPPVPPEDFAGRAGKYAGNFAFWRGNFSTIEKALGLTTVLKVAPTKDDTLLVSLQSGKIKQYAEIDRNLFRELSPSIPLIDGFSPRLIAFQENDRGAVTGLVIDGLPFMSMRRLPLHATPAFNYALLGFSMLVFVAVLLRRCFQRAEFRLLQAADRSAANAAVYAAAANLAVVISGAVVLSIVMDQLFIGIPLLFKIWLVFPIIATLAGIYLLYRTIGVWKQPLFGGVWIRTRYTVVALCGLFMCWFYWYWNILGFQYH